MEKCYNGFADLGLHGTGIPYQKLTALSFILIRACVHYALFEDEFYLKAQNRSAEGKSGALYDEI